MYEHDLIKNLSSAYEIYIDHDLSPIDAKFLDPAAFDSRNIVI